MEESKVAPPLFVCSSAAFRRLLPEFDPAAFDPASGDERYRAVMDAIARHYRGQVKVKTGIWRDLAVRRRKTEVDCQVGEVVRAGRAHGIATPLNDALIDLIHDLESGKRQMGWQNLDALAAVPTG